MRETDNLLTLADADRESAHRLMAWELFKVLAATPIPESRPILAAREAMVEEAFDLAGAFLREIIERDSA